MGPRIFSWLPFLNRPEPSETEIIEKGDRVFGAHPTSEEIGRHLDRELGIRYAPRFDLIRQASEEIQRRIESGEVDRQAGEAARSQMALQVGQAFKAEKAEFLRNFEAGLRLLDQRDWGAAYAVFLRLSETLPLPPVHRLLGQLAVRMGRSLESNPEIHYEAALESFRALPGETEGLGITLAQAALFHLRRGNRDRAVLLFQEALSLLQTLQDREKASLLKDLIRITRR